MYLRSKIIFVFLVLIVFSCSKEEKKSKEIVRVKDAVLTEDELQNALSEFSNYGKHREEYINEWIEQQILYQEAVNEGIIYERDFNAILERSKKKLASALLIEKVIKENEYVPGDDELKSYFEEFKDDFKLDSDSYRLNIAYFNNAEKAVQFRSVLIESDWNRALTAYRMEKNLVGAVSSELFTDYQLQPVNLQKAVSALLPGEISIVLETEPMKFVVVQLLEKLGKGFTPQFENVTDKVKDRFMIIRDKNFIRKYINKLIEDHNIEIKRYNE